MYLNHEEEFEEFENFEIKNEKTGEILELKRDVYAEKYFLIRHKNDDEISTKIDDLEEQFERETEITIWIDTDWK